MSAVVTITPEILIEQRVMLHDVPWDIYEGLMRAQEDSSTPRFTYEDGQLEIYMPSQKHEKIADFLADIVKTAAEEYGLEVLSLGSTTFKKQEARKGVEPDGCFYLQSYDAVFGMENIDLAAFPPDLVVEIDVTSPSLDRFPIYAGFRVPEIWRYFNEKVGIYILHGGEYIAAESSAALPALAGADLTRFLAASQTEKRSVWLKNIRAWVTEHLTH
jgi:Uma2 family endonuclease